MLVLDSLTDHSLYHMSLSIMNKCLLQLHRQMLTTNEFILDQNPVSFIAGLSFLPEFIIRALAAVTIIFPRSGGDNIQVSSDIKAVDSNIVVSLPWHPVMFQYQLEL